MSANVTSRPTLLIVESNRALLDRLARHFSGRGFAVTATHHPRQAVASATHRPYEEVLVGNTMPEVGGLRLCKMLRRSLKDAHLVLLSDLSDAALRNEALEAGVDVVLANSCRLSELDEHLAPMEMRS